MKAAIAITVLVMPVALQAVQAQDGAIGAQATEALHRIGDSIASMDRGSWLAFWGSFLIGIAVVATAIVSSWRYARHLSRQVRQSADHFKVVEKDMRVRKRPRLSWTDCTIEAVVALSGPQWPCERAIHIRLHNKCRRRQRHGSERLCGGRDGRQR